MARCEGSPKLSGTWKASTPPLASVARSLEMVGTRSPRRSHWNTALLNSSSGAGSGARYVLMSASMSSTVGGRALRAAASMAGDESTPHTTAPGNRASRTAVELPGPQPRSAMRCGGEVRWRSRPDTRSWTARVRSLPNLRYCAADQSGGGPPEDGCAMADVVGEAAKRRQCWEVTAAAVVAVLTSATGTR